ncbi:hypothetical protein H7I76_10660 [Mycolicibacterium vaccae]|nr:hypothetical protein [Mycolicibacterium vaccae]
MPAPFELFPTNLDPAEVLTALQNGAQQGFQDFINDLGSLSSADFGAAAPTVVLDELPSFTEIVNAISSAAASAYATLLPTADLLNALLIETPAYAATVFADELAAGDLVDAIGLPIAGLFGLGSIALGFEYIVTPGSCGDRRGLPRACSPDGSARAVFAAPGPNSLPDRDDRVDKAD